MPVRKQAEHRINEHIRGVDEVRLVGENVEQGVYTLAKAIELAEELGLDLVEISPNAVPPVCRITDYNKFIYEQKKNKRKLKQTLKKLLLRRSVSDRIRMIMTLSLN